MTTIHYMIFGTVAGLLVGLWPLIKGLKSDQQALAIGGFFASALSGAILGLLLCIPVSWIFAWAIKRNVLKMQATENDSKID